MKTVAQDLAFESRHAADDDTRQIAWGMLLRMAQSGDAEAWDSINELSRSSKRRRASTASIADAIKTKNGRE